MQSSTIPTAFQSAQPSQFLQPLLHNIRKSPQVFTIFYSHDNASSLPMMQSPWAQQPWQVSIAQERLNLNPQKRLNFYFQPAPKKFSLPFGCTTSITQKRLNFFSYTVFVHFFRLSLQAWGRLGSGGSGGPWPWSWLCLW